MLRRDEQRLFRGDAKVAAEYTEGIGARFLGVGSNSS
jgi:hypothetical protein